MNQKGKSNMKRLRTICTITLLMTLLLAMSQTAVAISKTYTLDKDFDEGILDGVNHDIVHDQLQLNKITLTFKYIWIANAGESTVSKIDATTGKEVGRYRTGPTGTDWSPSRTAIDIDGNAWAANRAWSVQASIVRILVDGGVDKNGNGVIDTSTDTNSNGKIDPSEILPWGTDERVITAAGTDKYDVGGVNSVARSLAIDKHGYLWVGLWNDQKYVKIDPADGSVKATVSTSPYPPYGAAIDKNGVLWSATLSNAILEIDTESPPATAISWAHDGTNYGIVVDLIGNVWTPLFDWNSKIIKFDPTTNTMSSYPTFQKQGRGIAVDADNNIWAAFSGSGTVAKFDGNTGAQLFTVTVGTNPIGVGVDKDNNIWVVNQVSSDTTKIKSDGTVIGTYPVGVGPYTYSDFTGFNLKSVVTKTGKWTVDTDSEMLGSMWNQVFWNDWGTIISVKAKSSNDGTIWSDWKDVINGNNPGVPDGRYLKTETFFALDSGEDSPILYDLTVDYTLPGEISGIKFDDTNGNKVKDSGEPGLAGWKIVLTKPGGGTEEATTLSDGGYKFKGLIDGTYTIGEIMPSGYIQTVPGVSETGSVTYTVEIVKGSKITDRDFGNFKLGKINGMKFEDLNANGIKDTDEVGLVGWNITISGTDTITGESVKKTVTTDADGNYNFAGLTAGTYTISETLKDDWAQTLPSTGTYMVIITSGSAIEKQNFGNFHKGKITGGGWIAITGDPKATFGLNGQYPDSKSAAQGNVEYQDHKANLNIKSIQINTVATTLDKKKGVITGLAQVNGVGSYPFVVYVEDNAEPGKDIDVFKISLPTYPYSNGAILSSGNIQIHK